MFHALPDPRATTANSRHALVDILTITLMAMLSGVDDYPGIVEFANDKIDFLSEHLALPHGVPGVSMFPSTVRQAHAGRAQA